MPDEWEYKVGFHASALEAKSNDLGALGWRLIQTTILYHGYEQQAVYERRKPFEIT